MNETAQPTSKVVRLPRDWLGPPEELVPFGRRATPVQAEPPVAVTSGWPPSAVDFWGGEQPGAVHDALEAPADGGGHAPATETTSRPAARPFGLRHRRLAAASLVLVAAAVATALFVLPAGSGQRAPAASRLNIATILSNGISRILKIGSPRIVSSNPVSRPHFRPVRPMRHRAPPTRPARHVTPYQSSPPPVAPTYAARATPAASPSYHPTFSPPSPSANTSPPTASASRSSGASVSATGESGAVGPVSSPNG